MDKNLTIIIHGPLEEDFLKKNMVAINKQIPNAHVIISTYQKEVVKVNKLINSLQLNKTESINIIGSEDVFNPGFFNINRQINLMNAALAAVEHDAFIIKVRMDQTINYRYLLNIVSKAKNNIENKLITTNCYTRADRWYHPSDMFLAGTYNVIRDYYPEEYFSETHLDNVLLIRELVKNGYKGDFYEYWPESRLFVNFLAKRGQKINKSKEDSLSKLKENAFIINSWDVSLKWKKFLKGMFPVLPYKFKMSPFPGGPEEDAWNYKASDINVTFSPAKEFFYTKASSFYFESGLYRTNPLFFNYRHFALRVGRRVFDVSLKFIPPIFHHTLVSIGRRIYHAIK